ncbi:MAG: WXG100 family type VII secretion target [Peptococcaceae bacterium]|nr:WXG100 family type VII secretion target [Peptococcaceae bacterium]
MISIDVQEAYGVAAKYEGAGTLVAEKIGELRTANEGELTQWVGQSKDSFIARFEELRPYMDQFVELVNEIASNIRISADNLESADAQSAGR